MKLIIVLLCLIYQSNEVSSYGVAQFRPPVPIAPKCVYFTGAGIYYHWQAGAAKYMQEHCDLKNIPVIGASAGALTSTLLLAGVDFEEATATSITLAKEAGVFESRTGLVGVWHGLIKDWLEIVIPQNIPMEKFSNLQISVTPVSPFQRSELITEFKDRADLIDACLASCHIPFFLDGKPFTIFRDRPTIDGSFYYFVTKDRYTGLPIPESISSEDIFWVDYGDDEEFMKNMSGNFLSLTTPEGAYEMINSGYNFMRKEHEEGRLPIARFSEPTLVASIVSGVLKIPKKINRLATMQIAMMRQSY
eukprot:gene6810-13796_t